MRACALPNQIHCALFACSLPYIFRQIHFVHHPSCSLCLSSHHVPCPIFACCASINSTLFSPSRLILIALPRFHFNFPDLCCLYGNDISLFFSLITLNCAQCDRVCSFVHVYSYFQIALPLFLSLSHSIHLSLSVFLSLSLLAQAHSSILFILHLQFYWLVSVFIFYLPTNTHKHTHYHTHYSCSVLY